jgi:catechol 2,3-dioxygenase-like lactoylglutathione lyase family enzyme
VHVNRLDHFTLRTTRLDETVKFFQQVAGLVPGDRPPFAFPGYWLYAEGVPVLHLAVFDPGDAALRDYLSDREYASGSGAIDHVAFRCHSLPAFEARLKALDVNYRGRTVPSLREHQVFVIDPNGVHIEFIFDSSEAASWAN